MNTTDHLKRLETLRSLIAQAQKQTTSGTCQETLGLAEAAAIDISSELTRVESERSALYNDVTRLIEALAPGETRHLSENVENILARLKKAHE